MSEIPRDRSARIVLLVFCALLLGFTPFVHTHGAPSVDVRTYIEMFVGVATHGLPYVDNGPIDRFPGLQVPWGVASGGHLWGMYTPVYAYFAAPFYRIGGIVLVSRLTFALAIPIALATFALARRLIREERSATCAAILAVMSTPVLGKGVEPTAYPLAVLLILLATLLALKAASTSSGRLLAFFAGILSGLGAGSHLLCMPMALGLLVALAFTSENEASTGASSLIKSLAPTRPKAARAAAFLAGLILALLPIARLNAIRFHSYNPFSYGAAPWRGGVTDDNMRSQIVFALPCFAFVLLVVAAIVIVSLKLRSAPASRRRVAAIAGILAASAGILSLAPHLRKDLLTMLRLACAFCIDLRPASVPGYDPAPESFGAVLFGRVVKSALEATPILLLIGVLPRHDLRTKHRLFCVAAPSLALLAYLLTRGNLPLGPALGWPFVGLRYTLPGLPMAVVLACFALRDVRLSLAHLISAIVVAAAIAIYLWPTMDDRPMPRQLTILALPLLCAVIAAIAMWSHRRGTITSKIAVWCVVPSFAVGIGLGVGHEFQSNYIVNRGCDARLDELAAQTPQRFAVIAWGNPINGLGPLRTFRDVELGDIAQWESSADARPLLDHWTAEGRPIVLAFDGPPPTSPWEGITFEPIEKTVGFYRLKIETSPVER